MVCFSLRVADLFNLHLKRQIFPQLDAFSCIKVGERGGPGKMYYQATCLLMHWKFLGAFQNVIPLLKKKLYKVQLPWFY